VINNSVETTGGPDVEYDYLAVYKTMYENASKITLNAMCRKKFEYLTGNGG